VKDNWPFEDPTNVAVITTRSIVKDRKPILLVTHDNDDGSWQFLDGGPITVTDGMVLALSEVVEIDPSVKELADLPYGWRAWRENKNSPWKRSEPER
jgi:hypothetical protein